MELVELRTKWVVCKIVLITCVQLLQLCTTLWDPMDHSPPGLFVHGILQARILEWVVMPSSRDSSQPRYQTQVSRVGREVLYLLVLEKAEEPEIKLPTSAGSLKKQEFQKNIYFCFIDYAKAFDCVDHNKLWKILQEMGIPDHLTYFWEICMQVRKQQLELDMEQQTGSK